MRTSYFVTYDISNPERLRRVFKVMRRFGDHLQLSVFRCILSDRELVRLRAALADEINFAEDQVLFVDMGPEEGRGEEAIEWLGRPMESNDRRAVVV